MTNSIKDITEDSRCIFIIGSNTTEQHPVIGVKIRRAQRHGGVKLIVADPRRIDIANTADLHLRHHPGTDIALLNGLMHVILREGWEDKEFIASRTEGFEDLKTVVAKYTPQVTSEITGVPAADIELAARMMAENRPGALIYAMGITQHIVGVSNVMSCANLQMLLGNMGVPGGGVNPLRGQNNVQGACDLGGLPNVHSGYQRVTDRAVRQKFEAAWGVDLPDQVGLTVTEMIHEADRGGVRCLYIIGENPMTSDPDLNYVRYALDKTEFIVIQELFFSETAQYADVVFPAASFAEKEGTFTNTERRIQRVRKAVEPPGEAKPDLWIITELANRLLALGAAMPDPDAAWADWRYITPADVMEEINALTPIYAGVTWERLQAGAALQWPVPTPDHPGTPVLHTRQFSRGKGLFVAADHLPPAELPDAEYPLDADHRPGDLSLARRRDDASGQGSGSDVPRGAGRDPSPRRRPRPDRRGRSDEGGLAAGRHPGQGAGDGSGRAWSHLHHLSFRRIRGQFPHQSRPRPPGQDPGVQGLCGEGGESG